MEVGNTEQPVVAELRKRVFAQVRSYLETERGVEPERLEEDTRFREDLDLDSIDLANLAVEWEEAYGFALEDERIVAITTVGDALDVVAALATRA